MDFKKALHLLFGLNVIQIKRNRNGQNQDWTPSYLCISQEKKAEALFLLTMIFSGKSTIRFTTYFL